MIRRWTADPAAAAPSTLAVGLPGRVESRWRRSYRLGSLNFASWNQIADWLKRLNALKAAA